MPKKGRPPQETEQFDPATDGVENLDELALRLQVPPLPEKTAYSGIALLSKSGRWYSVTELLAQHMNFTLQCVHMIASLVPTKTPDESEPEDAETTEKS